MYENTSDIKKPKPPNRGSTEDGYFRSDDGKPNKTKRKEVFTMAYRLNRILNVEKFDRYKNYDNAYAFWRMMSEYMGEFTPETLVENPDDIYFTTSEQIDKWTEETNRFCLDSILGRHEAGKISAIYLECDEENDGCANLEDGWIDMGNGTVHVDSDDWNAADCLSDLVFDIYDEETAMTYVIGTKVDYSPEFTIGEIGRYGGKPDDAITDAIVQRFRAEQDEDI